MRRTNHTFIFGTQKSGTTAIAALLSHATGSTATLDIRPAYRDLLWPIRLRQGMEGLEQFVVRKRQFFDKDIIKEPWLTDFAGELQDLFPGSRSVMIQRNPFETIRSVLNRLQIPGDLERIDFDSWDELNEAPMWRLCLDSWWMGRPCENYVEALAQRWDMAAQEYLARPDRYALIRYEDFCGDKKNEVERVASSLGLNVVRDISSNVDHQYQQRGAHDETVKEFFGAANLERIGRVVETSATDLGYDVGA